MRVCVRARSEHAQVVVALAARLCVCLGELDAAGNLVEASGGHLIASEGVLLGLHTHGGRALDQAQVLQRAALAWRGGRLGTLPARRHLLAEVDVHELVGAATRRQVEREALLYL